MKITIAKIAFLYWFLYQIQNCLTFLFFRGNPQMGSAISSVGKVAFALFLLTIILGKIAFPMREKVDFFQKTIFVFIGWMGFTLLWTHSTGINSSIIYWVTLLLEVVTVLLMFRLDEGHSVGVSSVKGILIGTSVISIIAFTMADDASKLGDQSYLHPNVIGNQFAIASICGMYLIFQNTHKLRKLFWIVIELLMISSLFYTLSKTAIIAFSISIVVFVLISNVRISRKIIIVISSAIVASIFYGRLENHWNNYKAIADGKVSSTFSGRTIIWEATWKKIQDNPIWGYGFNSFKDEGPQPFEITIGSAHNEFLNVWFNFGVVGLVLVIAIYLLFCGRSINSKTSHSNLGIMLLVYFLIRGLTEGHPFAIGFNLTLLVLMTEWMKQRECNTNEGGTYAPQQN